ncbi:MAG TPA: glycosyltransferase family 4 protein [Acidimicrobiales bacterium]|nr:glycosyltransferase family 4 protein [Acidimicrobiales bacterium]
MAPLSAAARRAVVVSPDPNSSTGGTERVCRQVAEVLARAGFEVTLLGPGGPAPTWVARQGGTLLWQAGSFRRAVRRREPRPDLVITVGPWGWPGPRRPPRIHVYVSNLVRLARHQPARWHWRARWALASGLAEALAARGATAVAISEQTAEDARRLYRADVARVVHLGVDTELFRPRDRGEARRRLGLRADARYGLFVGRAEPAKGLAVALDACRQVGWELVAVGSGPVPGSRALGVLPPEELAWAYAAADAAVLPSAYEGWHMAVGEALAAGVPAVTTPVGWARELGRRVPAYRPFVVPRQAPAVAAALRRVEAGEAEEAVAAGRALVLAEHTAAAFERRWRDLLADMGLLPAEEADAGGE